MGHVLLGFASPDAWKNEKTSSCTSFHIFPKVWIWKFFSKFIRKSWFFSIAKAQRANLTWFQPHSDQKCSGSVDSCGVRPRQTNTKKTHRDVVKKEWIISVFFEKKKKHGWNFTACPCPIFWNDMLIRGDVYNFGIRPSLLKSTRGKECRWPTQLPLTFNALQLCSKQVLGCSFLNSLFWLAILSCILVDLPWKHFEYGPNLNYTHSHNLPINNVMENNSTNKCDLLANHLQFSG